MRSSFLTAITLFFAATAQAADSKKEAQILPCTIKSNTSGTYYDLNDIAIHLPTEKERQKLKDDEEEPKSYQAKGYDYGANFTLNICAPVVEPLDEVVGIESKLWKNVSAYYMQGGQTFSIGQQSSELQLRGRNLFLKYTNGSPCEDPRTSHSRKERRSYLDEDDDEPENSKPSPTSTPKSSGRRKSTTISLLCEKDPLVKKPTVAFIDSPDECAYFFQVRTTAACGGIKQEEQAVGPAGVFGIIFLIAAAAYLLGGIAYQRTVMNQRGWRQLPNYSIWAGIASFLKDIITIATSSCTRCLPRSKGYNQLPTYNGSANGGYGRGGSGSGGRGRLGRAEDENRLIDQLDEEWDD
ncbi:MAG: Cation-independent mannose-6-phosphate receptor CI-MPR [Icmadophila ericetorum]|nr:Cation-independent mannose-6-phosphate receptor CI-MPR [Icmadophila ericetorum]